MNDFVFPLSGMRKEAAAKQKILQSILTALRKATPGGKLGFGAGFRAAEAANAAINYKAGNLTQKRIINALKRHNYDASQLPENWLRGVKQNPRYMSPDRFTIPPQYTAAGFSDIQLDRLPGVTDDTVKLFRGRLNKGGIPRFRNNYGQDLNARAETYIKPFDPNAVGVAEASFGGGNERKLIDQASRGRVSVPRPTRPRSFTPAPAETTPNQDTSYIRGAIDKLKGFWK